MGSDTWENVARVGKAAAEIAELIGRLVTARNVERVEHILPTLRASLEKARADLRAAIKYGQRKP
jgi:hypothetical protein